jgi:hypothetical protein
MSVGTDVADLPIASVEDDPVDHFLVAWCPNCDTAVDAVCPRCRTHVEASGATTDGTAASHLTRSEYYRRFLQLLQTARNTKFTLWCYLVATGDAYADGVTMKELARKWGVGTATVSKRCHLICALFGLRPSRYMRDEMTCAKFRLSNRRPRKME